MKEFVDNKVDIHSQIEFEKMDIKKLSEVEELEVTSGSAKAKEKDVDSSSNVVMVLRKIANHPLLVRCVLLEWKLKHFLLSQEPHKLIKKVIFNP